VYSAFPFSLAIPSPWILMVITRIGNENSMYWKVGGLKHSDPYHPWDFTAKVLK
jgi:hypothetical protein